MSQIDEYMKLLREQSEESHRAREIGREAVRQASEEAPYPPVLVAFLEAWAAISVHEEVCMTSGVPPEHEATIKDRLVALRRGLIDGFMERIRPIDDNAQEPAQDSAVGEQLELPLIPSSSSSSESA